MCLVTASLYGTLALKAGFRFAVPQNRPNYKDTQMDDQNKKTQEAKKAAQKEADFQRIVAKVEREWPIRCKLANLAGFKANPKNERALVDTDFDLTVHQLYLEVLFRKPENVEEALKVIRSMYEEKK